jgi:hypothetical protein
MDKIILTTSGIPQGSVHVIGPILFVLYINDMPEVTSVGTHTYLFADDTKAFRFGIFLICVLVLGEGLYRTPS